MLTLTLFNNRLISSMSVALNQTLSSWLCINTPILPITLLENVLAYHIKSTPFDFNWTKLTFGFSIGLSYVHDTPTYDDGSKDASNKKYRLLNYNANEASFWNQKEDSAVFFRIHHRSGMYGLIAPEGAGSNFLTLGVKRAW